MPRTIIQPIKLKNKPLSKQEILKKVKKVFSDVNDSRDLCSDILYDFQNNKVDVEYVKDMKSEINIRPIDDYRDKELCVIYSSKDIFDYFDIDKIADKLSKEFAVDKAVVEGIMDKFDGYDWLFEFLNQDLKSFSEDVLGFPCFIWQNYYGTYTHVAFMYSKIEFIMDDTDVVNFIKEALNYLHKSGSLYERWKELEEDYGDKLDDYIIYREIGDAIFKYADQEPEKFFRYFKINVDLDKFIKFASDFISNLDTDYWVNFFNGYVENSLKNESINYENKSLFEDSKEIVRNLFLNDRYRR